MSNATPEQVAAIRVANERSAPEEGERGGGDEIADVEERAEFEQSVIAAGDEA